MGVSSTTNTEIYNGDGVSTSFAFPFYFFTQADLFVYVYDNVSGAISAKTLGVDYTISGTANAQGLYPNGGNIVFGAAPANTKKIVISRFPIETQIYALLQNGTISTPALVQQFDYLTLLTQSLQDQVNRCLKLPVGFAPTFDPTLPSTAALAAQENATIIINALANGIDFGLTTTQIAADAAAAAASAAAAATSASAASTSAASSAASAASSSTSATASAASAAAAAASAAAAAAAAAPAYQEIPAGVVNGINTAFTVSQSIPNNGAFKLYLDGLILNQGTEYTISGINITMTTPPVVGQGLYAAFEVVGAPVGIVTGVVNSADILLAIAGGTLSANLNYVKNGTGGAPQLITAVGGISIAGGQFFTKNYIAGNGGAIIVTASPQITAGTIDGQELLLQGKHAVNTVELQNGNGLAMNGPMIIGLNQSIKFSWDASAALWVEICRQ